jgi:hypothetical protein
MKYLIIICLIVTTVMTSQAQEKKVEDCDCPPPDKADFRELCNSLKSREPGREGGKFSEKYQEDLWEMSCADLEKDSFETAKIKIQCMWNKYRVEFRCLDFSEVTVKDANVAKFSMDAGFSSFLVMAAKRYDLDMNFIDPADGKSLMDFLSDQRESYRNTAYTAKYAEYDRLYKLWESKGAKHAKDL